METQQHETRRPREYTKVTYLKKQIEEQNNKEVSNNYVINTLQPFFTLSTRKEPRKARRKKNTESITGKTMKYERVYLYQQTLLLKTQLVPMKELLCHHNLPNKVRYINKWHLCNQNNNQSRTFASCACYRYNSISISIYI